ncbi:uncharacterized protein LOC121907556 [Thunnus maccoyii]|uniref:uncharacterized protein LOC121907556 n=1 Tax=Thunnus maccoyii TaxID=8240 RepID=UPI001C4AB4AA|nr:uncharacterized protein LOC121907556 [Thunnus maccoyii]
MSGAKRRKLTHLRDEQDRADDERGAEQFGQEREMSGVKRRKLTHFNKRVEQRQGDERGAEELEQEGGAEESGAEELEQEGGAEELRQERATNPVTKTSPPKKRLLPRDETHLTVKKRKMDAPLSSDCVEASTSSCNPANRIKNLKQPTTGPRALPFKIQRDDAAVLTSTTENSLHVFVSRTKDLEQPETSQLLATVQTHESNRKGQQDRLKTRRSAGEQLQYTNRLSSQKHKLQRSPNHQKSAQSFSSPVSKTEDIPRTAVFLCSSCSKTEDTSAQQHFSALRVVPLLLVFLWILLTVGNQPTGDAGDGSQNLMENLQELKGLIPEECFMHAEHFVKDIPEVQGNHTDLVKFFKLLKEHLISQKQKPDGDAERFVKDVIEVPGNHIDLEKHSDLSKEHLISPKQKSDGAKVKVYSVVTGKTFGAHQVLLDKVKNVETTRDLQESHVVIVFCPITSRVGSDVEAAMTDIKGSCGQKPVILVLMHHTRDVDYSTDGKRWSDVYDNVVLDVHVLFHETERGLLTCPKNHQAVDQIQKELQKHADKHRLNNIQENQEGSKSESDGQDQWKMDFKIAIGFILGVGVTLLLQRTGDAGTGSQADKSSQTDFQHPEHKLDTSSPRHPEEGNSIPSASTGDEQESSDKKDSGQQSSDDGAKTQADTSSQKDPQNPEREYVAQDEVGQDDNQPSSSTNQERACDIKTGNVEKELRAVLQKLQLDISEECFDSAELVVKDYITKMAGRDLKHLLDFFHHLRNSIKSNKEEGSSIQSASTGDEQESSDKKDSGQQSSDDGAKTQADKSSHYLPSSNLQTHTDGLLKQVAHQTQMFFWSLWTPSRAETELDLDSSGNNKKSQAERSLKLSQQVTVKVFLVVTGETFGAHEVILEQVKKNKQLTVETTTDLQGCDIIIVFCPINSRLQSDVEAAMRNITDEKPVILVAMHHTRKPEHSTGRTAVSEKFPNVVLDVHVLFHETVSGLLTCPRNDQSVSQIQKELQKLSKHICSS